MKGKAHDDSPADHDPPKNISRIPSKGGHAGGWMVRIQRQGKRHQKYFDDKKMGGTQDALAAAVRWKEKILCDLPPPSDAHEERARQSETGVRGLSISLRTGSQGQPLVYVLANDRRAEIDELRSRMWSVRRYGWRRALWLACQLLGEWRGWEEGRVQSEYATAHRRIDREKYCPEPSPARASGGAVIAAPPGAMADEEPDEDTTDQEED